MRRFRIALLLVLGSALLLPTVAPQTGRAVEPAEKFLQGLRERGYADTALEYLDKMETSPLCPPELKRNITYERGITLVLAGRLERDPAKQEAYLNQAQETLNDFLKRNPKDPNVEEATVQLGNVLLERARAKTEQADRPKNADTREQLLDQARGYFDQAYDVFQKRLAGIKRELLDPKYKNVDEEADPATAEKRDALRGAYVQAQLMSATILRKKADTYKEGSAENKQGLQAAAEAYDEVYKKYRTRLAGLYARMYQARCLQQIGGEENHTEAITIYQELLEQPFKAPPLRVLRTKVIGMALECWLEAPAQKLDAPNYFQPALEVSSLWLKDARPQEDQDEDWLALRYWLAKTYKEAADRLDDKHKSKNPFVKEATALARHVAKYPGDHKKDAQVLLQELMGGGSGPEKAVKIEPQDFAEARSAGRDALDEVQILRAGVADAEKKLKTATGDKKAELEKQLAALKKSLKEQQTNAVDYFRQALALADEEISINDKNIIHYFLCYLYYLDGNYYNAAVTGEFLARHFPASTGARPCGKIAMASYLRLYKELPEDADREFEIRRTVAVADYIAHKWPTQPESQEALSTLIPFMIKLGRLDEAQEYLEKIDPATPRRGEAELQTGQAMWQEYLLGMQAIRDAEKGAADTGEPVDEENLPSEADLTQLRDRTQSTLANGIERMRQAPVDATLALAALSLAQVYVDTQQPQKAVELIEDENIGPKTLVESNSPAVTQEAYKIETYKVALRAYIGALPDVKGPAESEVLMGKADDVMDALKQLMGGTEAGQERLIRIFISLARDIEEQIQNAPDEKRAPLIRGFEVFLTRVGAATKDIKELFWVAQTFHSLGETSDTGGDTLTPQAEGFYVKAVKAYEDILQVGAGDKEAVSDDMAMQVKMRLATTKRRLREWAVASEKRGKPGVPQGSIDLFEQILLKRNMMLNVQIEATRTYQEWAKATAKPDDATSRYERAIMGGRTNKKKGKYTIWGWGEISRKTMPDEKNQGKYSKEFFEARYNLDFCRYAQGKLQTAKKERDEYFNLAKSDVVRTFHLFPDLGGDESMAKFDSLLKLLQKELGEKPLGLEAIKAVKEGPDLLKSLEEDEEEPEAEPEKETK